MKEFTYEEFKEYFESKRNYKPLGVHFGGQNWLQYYPEEDCFKLNYVKNRYYDKFVEGRAQALRVEATTKERDKWEMDTVVWIYPERMVIDPQEDMFHYKSLNEHIGKIGVYLSPNKTKGENGMQWEVHRGRKTTKIKGDGELTIHRDGRIETDRPVGVRTFDTEKQKELNRLIINVRRTLTIRAKLGAFQNVSEDQLRKDWDAVYKNQNMNLYRESFLDAIKRVDPEDINSLNPLLFIVRQRTKRYEFRGNRYVHNEPNWKKDFNNAIISCKETLRELSGVISYVPQGDTSCKNPESSHGATPDLQSLNSASDAQSSSSSTVSPSLNDPSLPEKPSTQTIVVHESTLLPSSTSAVA